MTEKAFFPKFKKHFTPFLAAFIMIVLFSGCMGSQFREQNDASITGTWVQYMKAGQDLIYGGTFRVTYADGKYEMAYVQKRSESDYNDSICMAYVQDSLGLSGILYGNGQWAFKSDWGNGNIGEFRLLRIGPDVFEGWSYLNGVRRTYNLWMRTGE